MKKHSIFFLLAAVFGLCFSVVVFAQDDYGLGATAGAAGLQRGDVPTLAGNVIGTALSIIGVLFFILMIYGGFLWMTARGNEEQTKKASQTITAAVIGMIIILASYAITNFVFEAVKGGGGSCQLQDPLPVQDPVCVPADCVDRDTEQVCLINASCCEWK